MHRTLTKNIRTCIWSLVIVVSIFIVSFLVYLAIPLPTIDDQRIVIYDRPGDILYTDYRYYQPTKSSEYTSMASKVVAIEDATFWRHPGISLRGLVRATRDAL